MILMSGVYQNLVSDIQEHKENYGKAEGFTLVILALLILCVSGFFTANFQTYGYSANLNTQTCITTAYTFFDYSNPCNNAGPAYTNPSDSCNGNPTNCSFHTISLLSPSTPLYYLVVQRNPIAFFESLYTQQEQASGFMIGDTLCIPFVNGQFANASGSTIQNFKCFGSISYTDQATPTANTPLNATSAIGNNSIWTFSGCSYAGCVNGSDYILSKSTGLFHYIDSNVSQATLNAFYIKNGTALTSTGNCIIYGQLINTCESLMAKLFDTGEVTTFTCPNTSHLDGFNINKTTYYCLIPVITTTSGYAGSNTNTFGFLAFLTGLVFMVIGLGIFLSFSILGSGSQIGANSQGTKLAQHYGLGILVFGVLNLAFGSGIFQFDTIYSGLGEAMFAIVVLLYFFGLWEVL